MYVWVLYLISNIKMSVTTKQYQEAGNNHLGLIINGVINPFFFKLVQIYYYNIRTILHCYYRFNLNINCISCILL